MVKKNNLRKIFAVFACVSCAAACAAVFAACEKPEEGSKDNLVSGDYNVDVTWSTMYQYNNALEYHVIIDAEDKTFELLNQTSDSKGAGNVEYEEGVYTLVYTDEKNTDKTTTFTYDSASETITFTSTLWINGVKFNRVDEDGETFVPYTAVLTKESNVEESGAEIDLVSGDYNVDVTWSTMYQYNNALEYHVIIDAEEKTFELLNQTSDSKGTGNVEYEEGVYTLVYTDEKNTDKTTTFTYDSASETITFTSTLWINGVKFNRVDEDGETFVPYTAVLTANS